MDVPKTTTTTTTEPMTEQEYIAYLKNGLSDPFSRTNYFRTCFLSHVANLPPPSLLIHCKQHSLTHIVQM